MNRLALPTFVLIFGLISPKVSAQVPQISAEGVVNGGSYAAGGPLAPGVIFSIFGSALTDGTTASATSTPLPISLAGATVLVNGVAAPLFHASPSQVNAHFPVELAGLTSASIRVQVQRPGGTVISPPTTVPVAPISPGIFTLNQNGSGPGAILRAGDFSKICPSGRSDCPANPAVPGEVISIFAIGLGQVSGPWLTGQAAPIASPTLNVPHVMIGGVETPTLFSGLATQFVGLYQVNVVVPANAPSGSAIPVVLDFGVTNTSNIVTIAIQGSSVGQPRGGAIHALAIDLRNPSTVYAGSRGGVFKTTNGAANWMDVNSGLMNPFVRALAVDPVDPSTVYAGTLGGGAFKSTNGGTNWSSINSGLTGNFVQALAVDPVNPSIVYAGTEPHGLFKSTNGGATWTQNLQVDFEGTAVYALAIDPGNPSTLYAGGGGVFKSTDGGTRWAATNGPYGVVTLALDPANPSTIYAGAYGSNGGVFKSTNGGATWTAMNSGLTNTLIQSLAVDPANPSTIYVGTEYGVFKTINGGANWTLLIGAPCRGAAALAIDPSRPATLYAGSSYYGWVFKSTDGGATWQPLTSGAGCWDY